MAGFIMAYRLHISFWFLLVVISGCERFDPSIPSLQSDSLYTPIVVVDDLAAVGLRTDYAQIRSAAVVADVLTLVVQYGGGCRKHEFALYGSRRFLESSPPQADAELFHNANGDNCKALITDTLRFSLSGLREAYQTSYGSKGTLLLRLHEPGRQEPISPLVRYEF